jgi:hypothetical protein
MAYYDNDVIIINIVNILITLSIIGAMIFIFLKYRDMQKQAKSIAEDYNKKFPAPATK